MTRSSTKLRRSLREAGLSNQLIQAAWPSWWSDELDANPSGQAELRFALARKLGVSPKGLLGERVEFIWNDEAKFKHLSTESANERAALTSFGVIIGRQLLKGTPSGGSVDGLSAYILRKALLQSGPTVDLDGLLSLCWSVGIPIIYLRLFPIDTKSMHAMVVRVEGRYAILLGKDAQYPAPVAFTLSHELGHATLGHLEDAPALVDLKDPATATDPDTHEAEADRFALSILTGQPEPIITTSIDNFNAPTLAAAAKKASQEYNIDAGTIALCLAYRTGAWARAMAALNFIYGKPHPVWKHVNTIAQHQLKWNEIGDESADYLLQVMGLHA